MMLRTNSSPVGGVAINRADFNGDGILDLVTVANSSFNQISVYPGRADGTFGPPINTSTPLPLGDVAIGDFNGDGKLDLAVTDFVNQSFDIFLGNGDGTFTILSTLLTTLPAVSITASDFNNDGKIDLAVGESDGTRNQVQIYEGAGNGTFSPANILLPADPSRVLKVRVGDFNADGKVDLAVLQIGALSAWFGNGNLTFDQVPLASFARQANDMNVADINQDSFTDILVSALDGGTTGGAATGTVEGYFGTPSRTLNHRTLIQSANATGNDFGVPGGLLAVDVNGDGINDLAAIDTDATSSSGLYVWLGNADGSFQQAPTKFIFTTDKIAAVAVAGDFNRDGKIDFAATNSGNSTLEVLLNATPRAPCQKSTANQSMTVCRPQDVAFSNSPLNVIAQGNSSNGVTDINVYVDNVLAGQFAASSINRFFSMANGDHFVVVKGFDATGASFRSDRHVTIYTGGAGQTCPASNPGPSVNVCLPAQNATLHSPVQIFANSYSVHLITAIQVYIDNTLVFNDSTATEVNKLFNMGLGLHFIVVKAWDAAGNQITQSRTITVN